MIATLLQSATPEEIQSLWVEPTLTPQTYGGMGWKVVAIVSGILAVILLIWALRKHRKNKYRRHAIKALNQLDYSLEALDKAHRILKATAIHALGPELKPETGRTYVRALKKAYPHWKITPLEYESFEKRRLQNELPEREAYDLHLLQIKNWIQHHGV